MKVKGVIQSSRDELKQFLQTTKYQSGALYDWTTDFIYCHDYSLDLGSFKTFIDVLLHQTMNPYPVS